MAREGEGKVLGTLGSFCSNCWFPSNSLPQQGMEIGPFDTLGQNPSSPRLPLWREANATQNSRHLLQGPLLELWVNVSDAYDCLFHTKNN